MAWETKRTISHPFRTATDLQLPFLYLQFLKRSYPTFVPDSYINKYIAITDDIDKMTKEFLNILQSKPKTVCLNDDLSSNPNPLVINALKDMFESMLPIKPSWEI
eukprot:gene7572-8861_t